MAEEFDEMQEDAQESIEQGEELIEQAVEAEAATEDAAEAAEVAAEVAADEAVADAVDELGGAPAAASDSADEWGLDLDNDKPLEEELLPKDDIELPEMNGEDTWNESGDWAGSKEWSDDAETEGAESGQTRFAGAAQAASDGAKQAGRAIVGATQGIGRSVATGFSAMREVGNAAREHAAAKNQLKEMQANLESDQDILSHRDQIEADYESIKAEQEGRLSELAQEIAGAKSSIERLTAESESLNTQLEQLKVDNEAKLRPYKQLWEAARGRAEDASRLLGEAKRALKSAEREKQDATSRKDQNVASANRALENSQERLLRAQDELQKLQSDPNAQQSAIARMQSEVAAELAHVDTARTEVTNAVSAGEKSVERAQAALVSQQSSFEAASEEAESAKSESATRKEEYDRLFDAAQKEEKALATQIEEKQQEIKQNEELIRNRTSEEDAAQAVLDEANDIHANPGVTAELRSSVESQSAAIAEQEALIDELATSEKSLRASTRTNRIAFVAALVLAVLVIAALVWFIISSTLSRRRKRLST